MVRRTFNAAVLASVLAPQLENRGRELFKDEGHYADFVAWREWWRSEIADPADQKELGQDTILGNMDLFTEIALYSAMCDWLSKQTS